MSRRSFHFQVRLQCSVWVIKGGKWYYLGKQDSVTLATIFLLNLPVHKDLCEFFLVLVLSTTYVSSLFLISSKSSSGMNQNPCVSEYKSNLVFQNTIENLLLSAMIWGSQWHKLASLLLMDHIFKDFWVVALLWPYSNSSFSFLSYRNLSLLNISAFGPGKAFESSPAQERCVPLLLKGCNQRQISLGPWPSWFRKFILPACASTLSPKQLLIPTVPFLPKFVTFVKLC